VTYFLPTVHIGLGVDSASSENEYKLGFFFLGGGRRGTRTPKHFVNLTEESKNF